MKIGRVWFENGVYALLGILVAVDGALFLHLTIVGRHTIQDSGLLFRFEKVAVPPPDGFTARGMRAEIAPKAGAGWAVRYAAKGCEYCREDELLWRQLATELQRRNYQVIVVVPDAKDEYPGDPASLGAVQQETYVNVGWIKQIRLTATPTLLIFGHDQQLIWSHQGVLSPSDSKTAIREIQVWREKSE